MVLNSQDICFFILIDCILFYFLNLCFDVFSFMKDNGYTRIALSSGLLTLIILPLVLTCLDVNVCWSIWLFPNFECAGLHWKGGQQETQTEATWEDATKNGKNGHWLPGLLNNWNMHHVGLLGPVENDNGFDSLSD